MSNQSKTISPGEKNTLLDMFLSTMPTSTQAQQKTRFASVTANFEFALFVPMQAAEQLAGEAMQKGFTVWVNIDDNSAFLYGAGIVGKEAFTPVMNWIRNSAKPGQKINVGIHNIGEPMKLIVVEV